MICNKKLIEVALPLEAINVASSKEKSIRQGHPSTLHLWWARRPLASARAVIFAQMVDDPSSHPEIFKTKEDQEIERQRLFSIIEDLVKWENTNNETVLNKARQEIIKSWKLTCEQNKLHPNAAELFNPNKLPGFHDPFAGGGALPLEGQRLGLESYATDLNPVPVLINKAMIEIPPKYSKFPPVNSKSVKNQAYSGSWVGTQGLAEDVEFYGKFLKDMVEEKISNLYPDCLITDDLISQRVDLSKYKGKKLTAIAWLWARTVKSPNPAYSDVEVPLISTYMLSTKDGKEAYIKPVIEGKKYRFDVKLGKPESAEYALGTKLSRGANFKCIMSNVPIPSDYIKAEGKAGRMGARLIAIVAEGDKGRVYLPSNEEHEKAGKDLNPLWRPDINISGSSQYLGIKPYGIDRFDQLFTDRQLVALNTFSDLLLDLHSLIAKDFLKSNEEKSEVEAKGYADAVVVYLTCALGKLSDYNSTICSWISGGQTMRNTFGRQAIPMMWDYAEANVLSDSTGGFLSCLDQVRKVIIELPGNTIGHASQNDAQTQSVSLNKVISTDPPYYDNIPYADLSDFFYVWFRRCLKTIYSELFSTMAVPKSEELVAFAYRHENGKTGAEAFFMEGMTKAMLRLSEQAHPNFPVTIYYAFKQSESDNEDGTTNTGWDTFLAAVIEAGFSITGTWPIRTELANKLLGVGSNMLASSIVLVCRKRPDNAKTVTRSEFSRELKSELPIALSHLQAGNIAPVDLAQAAIGPGMSVYSRFKKVLDAEGKVLSVRSALSLINQTLDECLAEQEGYFDSDTRWALTWFEQNGFSESDYGIAEQLSKSKNTSVSGLVEAGILYVKAGKVRLLKPSELPVDWDPRLDKRLTIWEIVHHLVRVLEKSGETAASRIVANLGANAETARELCYRLYTICERKKRANEAMSYNGLVQSWLEISRLALEIPIDLIKGDTVNMFDQDN